MKIRLVATGSQPIIMHNIRLASPMDPFAKELARLNKAKPSSKRTDEERLEMARVEWEGSLYWDDVTGPFAPGSWVFKNLLEAARSGRRGKKIEGGVVVATPVNPLLYRGPRKIEDMWGDGDSEFVDFRSVRVGQAKVDRCRPIFKDWKVESELYLDTGILDLEELQDIASIGGRLYGYGDYRQQYGRFEAEVTSI